MSKELGSQILSHLKSERYRPVKPRPLAKEMHLTAEDQYHAFRDALRELMHAGRVVLGGGGNVMLPDQNLRTEGIVGTYRHNKRGFGFVVPSDPDGHEDLFIAEGDNAGAITGDIVRAKITNREPRDGKVMFRGKITEIITRSQKRFVGTLVKQHTKWLVLPDGNVFTDPILTPDAAARHIRPGTKVVVELTTYPQDQIPAQGVITRVLGQPGEKDVDLQAIIVQFNLPQEFPDECLDQARAEVDRFNAAKSWPDRMDLSDRVICTIDPDDAKDYDDAISLRQLEGGEWELGVHIADVSTFVGNGTPLDVEAKARGNSCYFPGFVIPMLPEILSNGVCSLQEGVPRLCKSAFIVFDEDAHPIRSTFANTVIRSANRLRYTEAQAIIDNASIIHHPDGPRKIDVYDPAVVELLHNMDDLAHRIQKRRLAAGQLVLDLPEVDLVLDDQGKIVDAKPEDQSFTHTLIEMFMVEANEAVARLLDSIDVPFLRRTHPEPEPDSGARLKHFVEVAGFRLPKDLDRKAIQSLLASVKGKPQSFTINLAILKSLTRAEYSPRTIGHYALASQHYCHFTSPIRRYADLTIHRLLEQYLTTAPGGRRGRTIKLNGAPTYGELVELGKHISFTERQADDAERELRKVKVLELLSKKVGEDFPGVITGITNFGIFVQITTWLIDGLIRYEDLMDDWWQVDERGGFIRGQRTGTRIRIGDTATVRIVRVDPARRELGLAVIKLHSRSGTGEPPMAPTKPGKHHRKGKGPNLGKGKTAVRGGGKFKRRRR
ncbi:MAG TPA: ribonuclease R [Tepidisphaeraceae bacterium]|jgi:ribonuclease R